jgi:hypothetical protein
MANVTILIRRLHEVRRAASSLCVGRRALLDYLLLEHNGAIAQSTLHLVRELDDTPPKMIVSTGVSTRAATLVRDLVRLYDVLPYSITSFIVADGLPGMLELPESYPGLGLLMQRSTRSAESELPKVGLTKAVYERVCKRILQTERWRGGAHVTRASFIDAVLAATPEHILTQEPLLQEMCELAATAPKTRYVSARVQLSTYALLRRIKDATGLPMATVASFLVDAELRATEQPIEGSMSGLPKDPVQRWHYVLRHLVSVGMKAE